MGKGAATKELMSLPLSELERRCRHNGLSLAGGRETMVARLLSLEEAERQKGYELDVDLKGFQSQSTSGFTTGYKEIGVSLQAGGFSGWDGSTTDGIPLSSTLQIPHPPPKAFAKREKTDPALPESKWDKDDDDDESDDDQKRNTRGIGLSYSSSGSEDAANDRGKADEVDFSMDGSVSAQPYIGLNEEQRQKLRRLEVALIEYRESLEERGTKSSEEIERKVTIQRKRLEVEYGLLNTNEDATKKGERGFGERKERQESSSNQESSPSLWPRKRRRSQESGSESPGRRRLPRENEQERERERHRRDGRGQVEEIERRSRREKSGSKDRDDHERRDVSGDRDVDRRRRYK